jgi:hypothetical protein
MLPATQSAQRPASRLQKFQSSPSHTDIRSWQSKAGHDWTAIRSARPLLFEEPIPRRALEPVANATQDASSVVTIRWQHPGIPPAIMHLETASSVASAAVSPSPSPNLPVALQWAIAFTAIACVVRKIGIETAKKKTIPFTCTEPTPKLHSVGHQRFLRTFQATSNSPDVRSIRD